MISPEENEIREQRRIIEIEDEDARDAAFHGLLKRYPHNKVGLFSRAFYCVFHGDLDEAEALLMRGLEAAPVDFEFYLGLSQVWIRREDEARHNAWLKLAVDRALADDGQWKRFETTFEAMEGISGDSQDRRGEFFHLAETLGIESHSEAPAITAEMAPYRLLGELLEGAADGLPNGLVDRIMVNRNAMTPLLVGVLRNWFASEKWADEMPVDVSLCLLGQTRDPALLPVLLEFLDLERDSATLCAAWAIWQIAERHPLQAIEAFRNGVPGLTGWARGAVAEILMNLPEEVDVTADLTGLCAGTGDMPKPDRGFAMCSVTAALLNRDSKHAARDAVRRYSKLVDSRDREFLEGLLRSDADWRFRLEEAEVFESNVYDACSGLIFEGGEDDEFEDDEFEDDEFEDDELDEDKIAGGFDGPPLRVRLATGRNDPCWCLSGKKYKKCHLRDDEEERRAGNGEDDGEDDWVGLPPRAVPWDPDGTIHRLQEMLISSVGPNIEKRDIKDALERFTGHKRQELEEENQGPFMDWLLHDYVPAGRSRNLIEEFLQRQGASLGSRERSILEGWSGNRLSLYEVQSVEEGTGLVLRDLLRGGDCFVHDRSVSGELVRWDCTVCRIEPFEDKWIFSGNGTLVTRELLPRVKAWAEAHKRKSGLDWEAFLKRDGHLIRREAYLASEDLRKKLQVSTSDGEELVFSTSDYELTNPGKAIEALRKEGDFDEREEGSVFVWLGGEVGDGRRVLGHVRVSGGTLRLECNSRERLKRGRKLLEKMARGSMRHKGDEFKPWQAFAQENAKPGPVEVKRPGTGRLEPDVEAEFMGKYYEQHYGTWPDQPLPALEGLTPRAAVASAKGRARVVEMIKLFESSAARERKAGKAAYDFSRLRAELGLEEEF